MKTIEESIEIAVPVSTAYNQWTQFESFPRFMDGIDRVEQRSDTRLRGWPTSEARSANGTPTSRSSIRTSASREGEGPGRPNGVVMFQKLDDAHTKVKLRMAYEPGGMKQAIGSAFGIDSRRVKGDLESFKEFIEARGSKTGAWRGEVER